MNDSLNSLEFSSSIWEYRTGTSECCGQVVVLGTDWVGHCVLWKERRVAEGEKGEQERLSASPCMGDPTKLWRLITRNSSG